MSHLEKKKQILMTSHVLVMAAWEFVPPNISMDDDEKRIEDDYYDEDQDDEDDDEEPKFRGRERDRGRRIPALICTAPLSRALVANVFVQTRNPLYHRIVEFFLHYKVIPAFRVPVSFVYCVLIHWRHRASAFQKRFPDEESSWFLPLSDAEHHCRSAEKLVDTVYAISETMPHIQTLDVENLPCFDGKAVQLALAMALPKTLWSLRLHSADFCFNAGFLRRLSKSCPFLERLKLENLDSDGWQVMFSSEKNLFPKLKMLSVGTNAVETSYLELDTVWTPARASLELYNRIFGSKVVSSAKLEALEICPDRAENGEPHPEPSPSLKPLERLHSISNLLSRARLPTVPDFSVLHRCSELTALLQEAAFTGNQQQVVVDLSDMPCLTSLGACTLSHCKGVDKLVLPPTLRTVGREFCRGSTVGHIDFSVCADSLRFVDTEFFLCRAEIGNCFSTLPLLGKIGTVVGSSFLSCRWLHRVDLRGLQGIVEIKHSFLRGTAVEELDLSILAPTCTKIGRWFLADCSSLKKVTGCGGLAAVTSVGDGFLRGTKKLEEFDFAAMKGLAELEATANCFVHHSLMWSSLENEGWKTLGDIMDQNCKRRNRNRCDYGEDDDDDDSGDEG